MECNTSRHILELDIVCLELKKITNKIIEIQLYKSHIKYYNKKKYLQGRVKFPTGGKAREPKGMIR